MQRATGVPAPDYKESVDKVVEMVRGYTKRQENEWIAMYAGLKTIIALCDYNAPPEHLLAEIRKLAQAAVPCTTDNG